MSRPSLTLGFIVNPYAGVGGPAALKGSDAQETQAAVDRGELSRRALGRARQFLEALNPVASLIHFRTIGGLMGGELFDTLAVDAEQNGHFNYEKIACSIAAPSTGKDTQKAAMTLLESGVDIVVFVGGDGTARDIFRGIKMQVPVLGVPSGVKMHSGVFGINPQSSAAVIASLARGEMVGMEAREVRDIDEAAFQKGIVRSEYYGELHVPVLSEFVQAVKQGGMSSDASALQDIADDIDEAIAELNSPLIIFGPGSTTQFIQKSMGLDATLLGVDVYYQGKIMQKDASSEDLSTIVEKHLGDLRLVITAIGGQGHIIGRGNQQLSPGVLKKVQRHHIWVVMTPEKLHQLEGKPLWIDSGDAALDRDWKGLIPVINGYRSQVLYRLG